MPLIAAGIDQDEILDQVQQAPVVTADVDSNLREATERLSRDFDSALAESLQTVAASLKAGLTLKDALYVAAENCPPAFAAERAASEKLVAAIATGQKALADARREESVARERLSSAQATLAALRAVDADVEKSSPLVAAMAADDEARASKVA